MNILVIDNNTSHLRDLITTLGDHHVEVQEYKPGLDFHTDGKDVVVLSGGGGEGREANNKTVMGKLWYEDEIDFIRQTKLPLVGICMGFELIAKAFGSKIEKLPRMVHGFRWIESKQGRRIKQFEAHRWGVQKITNRELEVIAHSGTGIELIRHRWRPIIASQFHPEVGGGSWDLSFLLNQLRTS